MTTYAARLAKLRRLAAADVSAAQLEAGARQAAGQLWARRAEGELSAAATFSGLHQDCLAAGLNVDITRLAERAVEDERFHGALSVLMAEHYLDASVPSPVPRADAMRFESCVPDVALALRFLLHCALSETVAVAYLRECHREAASVLVRSAVRELLHDEIDHSRVGWAYVASAVRHKPVRDSFRRELPALLATISDAWSKPVAGAACPLGHGALSDARTRQVTEAALRTLLLPGLARFGIVPDESSFGARNERLRY